MRLIDAENLLVKVEQYFDGLPIVVHHDMVEFIKNAPSVDAVQVVRCKDCKYYLHSSEVCGIIDTRLHFYETDKRWSDGCFCSWGERKETEDA